MKLDDNSFTPLYQQVLEDIKSGIYSGTYSPGQRIPSEAELSQLYSVSRVTVRRAIEELVSEGYLTKRQGKGTYVNQLKLTQKIRGTKLLQNFAELCAEMGYTPSSRTVDRHVIGAQAREQLLLGTDCERLVYISRVHSADGVPISEERSTFPYEDFAFLLEDDLNDIPLFELIRIKTGRVPTDVSQASLEIALADASMARLLAISAGDPLFYANACIVDQDGRPLCISSKYLVGSRCAFRK